MGTAEPHGGDGGGRGPGGRAVGLAAVLAVQTRAKADLAASLRREISANTALAESNAELTHSRGILLAATGDSSAAETEHRKALALRHKLADDNPNVPGFRDGVASAYTNHADLVRSIGRPADARDGYERAIAIRESLIQQEPTTTIYRGHLAYSLRRRGLARGETGDPAVAAADARRALALYDELPSRSGQE